MIEKKFRCIFCDKSFTRESWFRKHNCEKRKQFATMTNLDQIKALKLFNHWCKRNGYVRRGKERTFDEFKKSPYSKNFTDLVQFGNEYELISLFKYLNFLMNRNVHFNKWCTQAVVDIYRKDLVDNELPDVQAKRTIAFINQYCQDRDVPRTQFFQRLGPAEAVQMIISGQIAPWVLFGYDPAVTDLLDRLDQEKICILDEHLNLQYWINKVNNCEGAKAVVDTLCQTALT